MAQLHARRATAKRARRYGCNRSLTDDVDRRSEDVPDAALGADELGRFLARLDLLAQAADLYVDRAVVHLVVMQARKAEQLVAREHALRRGEERREQVELAV